MMDNTLFEQLNIEESILIEKLRVLREFRNTFFNSENAIKANQLSYLKNSSVIEVLQVVNSAAKNTAETVTGKVLNALALIKFGRTKDVANKLMEVYPEYKNNEKRANKHARYYLSASKLKGEIEVIPGTTGPGNTYRHFQQ